MEKVTASLRDYDAEVAGLALFARRRYRRLYLVVGVQMLAASFAR